MHINFAKVFWPVYPKFIRGSIFYTLLIMVQNSSIYSHVSLELEPFQVNKGHGNPKMPVEVIQGL